MTNLYAILIATIPIVAITGFYLTAVYIVAKTGSAEGITHLGKAATQLLRTFLNRTSGGRD